MILDASAIPAGGRLEAEVCIAGSGPAGLTLASELERLGRSVLLLEAGARRPEPGPDLDFSSPDFDSPASTRRRGVGGMASSWSKYLSARRFGIRLLPLDAADFEAQDWVPDSGWPFGREQLQPYYARAGAALGLSPQVPISSRTPLAFAGDAVDTRLDQHGGLRAFTRDLPRTLARSARVQLLTGATAVRIAANDGASAVRHLLVRRPDGGLFEVHAGAFVVAAGAIENARLLLASNDVAPRGLGNDHDLVGRYYMDHLYVDAGVLRPSGRSAVARFGCYDMHSVAGKAVLGKLQLPESRRREERLLNANAELMPIMRERVQRALAVLRPRARVDRSPRRAFRAVPVALDLAASAVPMALRQRTLAPTFEYGWSSRVAARHVEALRVVLQVEQAPDPSNRVTLLDRVDADGLPRARLEWRWSALDVASVERTRAILGSELERSGIGRLEPPGERVRLWLHDGAHHHLGTTRMHRDPAHGVVDAKLRVHGLGNLFVAGGSVFPTGGYANPTLTIVALSMRLADHLARTLEASSR